MRTLLGYMPKKNIRLGKRLIKYTYIRENGPIGLQFSDGTRAICDVLIGCDGIRSTIREQFIQKQALSDGSSSLLKHVSPRWSGTVIYRSLIPKSRLATQNPDHRLLSTGQIVSIVILFAFDLTGPLVSSQKSGQVLSVCALALFVHLDV